MFILSAAPSVSISNPFSNSSPSYMFTSNLLYFDTDKQTDLETGFVQYYVGYCDQVLMSKDGITTMVSFYNPNPLGSYEKDIRSIFLVSDKLQKH